MKSIPMYTESACRPVMTSLLRPRSVAVPSEVR